jgi:two-component system, cell cycle sensor histidine kinase and response regulator CckA
VESDLGKGTTVHVYLPASSVAGDVEELTVPSRHTGRGRILVMDDEHYLLDVVSITLRGMGYEVVTAEEGDQAVEIVKSAIASRHPFAAAILDLTIPGGRGGQETVHELLRMDPNIKIIASSGYSEDPVMSDPVGYGFTTRLVKPYRKDDLIKVLESVLGCADSTAKQ